MNFGDRLKGLRGPLSQAEAATKAKITQQMWSKLESGRSDPRRSAKVRAIARAWGMSVEELLAGLPDSEAAPHGSTHLLEEPVAAYAVTGDDVIRQAREYWERAIESNRPLALMIAKIILIVSSTPASDHASRAVDAAQLTSIV